MRILVVGSGGREHALVWKLAQEAEVHAAPGNPGMAEDCEVHDVPVSDYNRLVGLASGLAADLVVIGPENPLIDGLADSLRYEGIAAFGPGIEAARLEGSKAFAKEMMRAAGVPTAAFRTFQRPDEARLYARERFEEGRPVVVKASGNALGKGVVVCSTVEEAEDAIHRMMDLREFGDQGDTVVIEDRIEGREFSLITLCTDGETMSLPVAQDYKRVGDGDAGPNTGGMGSYSPVPWIGQDLIERTEEEVVRPILATLGRRGIPFRGALFSGIIVRDGRPYCLEYNVRFGDPETQSIMMRLGKGLAFALLACAKGHPIPPVETLPNASATVVLASEGYPGPYQRGLPIEIGDLPEGVKLFHAGSALREGSLVTAGGRVLAATAAAATLEEARVLAYEGAKAIRFQGATYRRDIARQPATVA